MKKLLKDAINFRDYESEALLIAQTVKLLRVEATSYGDFQVVFINVTNNPQTMT